MTNDQVRRWPKTINKYREILRKSRETTSLDNIQYYQKEMKEIRNKWKGYGHVFDRIESEFQSELVSI